jgi:hypothetical protein
MNTCISYYRAIHTAYCCIAMLISLLTKNLELCFKGEAFSNQNETNPKVLFVQEFNLPKNIYCSSFAF